MEEEKAPQSRFIKDGMNDFERSVKRIGDCILALIALIVFSPLFLICYRNSIINFNVQAIKPIIEGDYSLIQ